MGRSTGQGLARQATPRLTRAAGTSNEQMLYVLHCTREELVHLKAVVKDHMQKPLYDGVILLGQATHNFEDDKKQRIRDALWESVIDHDVACSEMLSGSRWAEGTQPPELHKHLRTVLLKIVSLHQAALALKKKAGTARMKAKKPGHVTGLSHQPAEGRRQRRPMGPRVVEVDSDGEEMIVVREPRDLRVRSLPAGDGSAHTRASPAITTSIPASGPEAANPAQIISGPATAPDPVPPIAPAQPASGPNFNEQVMTMMIQNQSMMLQMMAEIKDLKKGGQ
ncbi:uncharacterized protein MYCFIDRAFT_82248 [Pseudocercospora fijiensis CIRAD86]|uniref:Uncharacterized protein n=1 Tax=Pseudocercospora fijiensis (strain CIRAD86) TaxID=383855 RepID=M3ACP1_PSEFD|nr:uncharacterized protein MYCFIDRAFT_82248 [Pseudocercospora fijiensis CIRAD86]EME82311.1 hypothetical protein MYCFIDRAFT_82248 [Pseudocercospora fijiensis CIRAD86]